MIVLKNLTKTFFTRTGPHTVIDRANAVFPSGKSVALMGRNGAGKSTLLEVMSGISRPTSGEVLTDGQISFPVGLASSLHPDMSGSQNCRFVARIYGADTGEMIDFVKDFSELGKQFDNPVRTYSSGMRSRLSFGINMALQFDTYLIDEVTAVGDRAFRQKAEAVFFDRIGSAGAVFINHSMSACRRMCTAGAVIEKGRLTYYEDLEEAIEVHEANLSRPPRAA